MANLRVLLLLSFLCLFSHSNGGEIKGVEVEVRKAAIDCCNTQCSDSKLTYLHDIVSIYKSGPNAKSEVSNFADSVLGGMRCDNHAKVAKEGKKLKRDASSMAVRGNVTGNSTQFSLNCPSVVTLGSNGQGVIECTTYIYDPTGINYVSLYTSPAFVQATNSTRLANGTTGPLSLVTDFIVNSAGNYTVVAYYYNIHNTTHQLFSTVSVKGNNNNSTNNNTNNTYSLSCPSTVYVSQGQFTCQWYVVDNGGIYYLLTEIFPSLNSTNSIAYLYGDATSYTLQTTFYLTEIDLSATTYSISSYYLQYANFLTYYSYADVSVLGFQNNTFVFISCPSTVYSTNSSFICYFEFYKSSGFNGYSISVSPQTTTYGITNGTLRGNTTYYSTNVTYVISNLQSSYYIRASLLSGGVSYFSDTYVSVISVAGSVNISCPQSINFPNSFFCYSSIQDPSGVSQAYVTIDPGYVDCSGCSYYNYYNSSNNAGFTTFIIPSVNYSVPSSYFITVYYYNGYGYYGNSASTTVTVINTNPTNSSIVINCPSSAPIGQYFTCTVQISSSVIYDSYAYATPALSCYGCSSYGQSVFYPQFYGWEGAYSIVAYFEDNTGYKYSNNVTVYIASNASFEILWVDSPASVGLGSNGIEFNVSVFVESTNPVSYAFVSYSGPGGLFAGYPYYSYNYSSFITFNVQSYYYGPITPGTYCPSFYFQDIYGNSDYLNSTSCIEVIDANCDAGFYISSNSSECVPCPQGFYSANRNSPYCDACPSGYTSSCVLGSRSCVACPAGTTSQNGVCQPCAPGTFSSWDGQDSCTPCYAGTYTNQTGSTGCYYCSGGTYSCAGATQCTACAPGSYSSGNSESCTQCLPGTYSSGISNSYCQQCPSNTYAGRGAVSCIPCPPGTSSRTGSFACVASK